MNLQTSCFIKFVMCEFLIVFLIDIEAFNLSENSDIEFGKLS